MGLTNELLRTCPHCGNKTVLKVVAHHWGAEALLDDKDQECGGYKTLHVLLECRTCSAISVFYNDETCGGPVDEFETYGFALYPAEKKIAKGVPELVADSYREALKVKKISPQSFVILIGRALEIICEEQNAPGRRLSEKLKHLADKQIIPKTLGRMADVIRLLRNIGAHDFNERISASDAQDLDEFFSAILEYVYVAPHKVRKLEERLSKKRASSKSQDSDSEEK